MSEQGTLAEVRRAIEDRVETALDLEAGTTRDARRLAEEAKTNLESALAAAEARIGRLARFVKADDALDGAIVDFAGADEYNAAAAEKQEARAAITAEDVAP